MICARLGKSKLQCEREAGLFVAYHSRCLLLRTTQAAHIRAEPGVGAGLV